MSQLNEFDERSEFSLHDILINLLDSKNIEMKTEISNPSAIAVLKIIAIHYKLRGQLIPYKILKGWIKNYSIYMVSHDRLSRTEIIEALKLINEQKREIKSTIKDKLVGKID